MTKLRRSMTMCWLFFGVLLLAVTSRAQTRPPIVEQLAKTYGLDSFGQLDAIRYTFNLELPDLKVNLSRTWTWEPKTGQVTYESKDKDGKPVKVSYVRSQISSAPANVKDEVEPAFVNDNYWFIFPFHAYWDTSAIVTVKDMQKLPLGKGSAKLVSVKYPPGLAATRREIRGIFSSGRMGELRNSPIIAVDRRSRVSSPQLGRATRKLALCLSQPTIAA